VSGERIDGWYFAPQRRVQLPDAYSFIGAGWTFRTDDPEEMRRRRFLAWPSPVFAFTHTGGMAACRVTVSGLIHTTAMHPFYDRSLLSLPVWYGTTFTVQWLGQATHLLQLFVCDLAEQVLARERAAGREYDPHSTTSSPCAVSRSST